MPIEPITISDLTQGTVNGTGVFDELMKAVNAQIDYQFKQTRLQGSDFATVYLGSMQATLNAALNFLNNRDKLALEANLIEEQINSEKLNQLLIKAQTCKLKAEYDLTIATIAKTNKESDLLAQKITTEKAQVLELGVDDNSVIGRQKALYKAQTDGFKSDKIQKGTKILVDSWQARRMTDDGVVADNVNKLADSFVGQGITVLLADMGA